MLTLEEYSWVSMAKRGKYKPKEENVRKLFAFIKQIEQKQQNQEKELSNKVS
jgi:hypothetical protein